MEDKKNIDRLFQEKFRDFKPAAPADSWEAIEARLDKDKKRPAILPLWWKVAGVAAVLAVLLSVFIWNTDDTISNENMVIDESLEHGDTIKSEGIVIDDSDSSTSDSIDSSVERFNNETNQDANGTVTNNNDNGIANRLDNEEPSKIGKKVSQAAQENKAILSQQENSIAQNSNSSASNNSTALNSNANTADNRNLKDQASKPVSDQTIKDAVAMDQSPTESEDLDKERASLESLEDIAAANNVSDKEEDPVNRKKWRAATVVAPVYASSLNGSSINDRVSRDSQNAQTDISYGVAVSYAIDSRWSVRTGLHQVNVNYNNENINYGLNANTLILNNDQATTVYDVSAVNAPRPAMFASMNSFDQELRSAQVVSSFNGEMSQQLGYLEMPFEVSYRLVDKKFGVSVLGGFSALLLTNNNVSIVNDTRRLDLGSDDNFNDFNQSANFGLGIDYQFAKNLGLTLEPTFKYQLSSLKENTADFRPYTIGVYTGLMYRF